MWYPDAGESMLSSVDELPPSSQLLVYVLTLKEPPAAVRELATQDQWERLVEARARQALQYGDYELVRKLLSERDTRCEASALYAIAALVAMHSGDQAAAAEQLRRGIDSAQAVNRIDRLAELWRLRGELFEQHRDFANATAALAEAQGLAMRMGAPALALQICAERSRLHEAAGAPPPGPAEIEEIVKACGDSDFASVRLQLRGLFRNCGPYSVALLVKGLRVFKLQFIPRTPDNEEWTQELMLGAQQGRLNEYLQGRLEREPENETVRRVIADALEDALNPNRSARSA